MGKKIKIFYLIVLVLVVFITTKPYILGQNDLSRYYAIIALTERHTFAVDFENHPFVDAVYAHGKYYSSKPPVLSLLGAGVYWVMYHLFQQKLYISTIYENLSVYFINLVLIGGSIILLIIFFFKSLKYYNLEDKNRYFLSSILVLSTLIFSYSGALNNHIPCAALIFAAFYYLLKQIKEGYTQGRAFVSGFYLAAAFAVEPLSSIFFIFCLFIFQFFNINFRRHLFYYIFGLAPMFIFYALLNIYSIGRLLPTYFYKDLYNFPGSYWLNPIGFDVLSQPKIIYLFNLLVGTHGLFIYSPILIFFFYGLKKIIINQEKREIKGLTYTIVISIIIYIISVVFITKNFGGDAYGARWFISFVPLLFFYLAIYYPEIKKRYHILFVLLLVLSIIFSILGYLKPWSYNAAIMFGKIYYIPLLGKFGYLSDIFLR